MTSLFFAAYIVVRYGIISNLINTLKAVGITARCIIGNAVGYIAGLIGTAFVSLCGVVKDIVKSIFG